MAEPKNTVLPEAKQDNGYNRKKYLLLLLIIAVCSMATIVLVGGGSLLWINNSMFESTADITAGSRLDRFKERFDVLYVNSGELELNNFAKDDPLVLTDTGGMVKHFVVSPNEQLIAYAVSAPDKFADLVSSTKSELVPKLSGGVTLASLPFDANIPAEGRLLDLETMEDKVIIPFEAIPLSDSELDQWVLAFEHIWTTRGIGLLGFHPNGGQVVYDRAGTHMMNLITNTSTPIAGTEILGGCFIVTGAIITSDRVVLNRGCYEWSESDVYELANGTYTELVPPDNNSNTSGIGEARGIFGHFSDEKFVGDDFEYNFDESASGTARLRIIDPTTLATSSLITSDKLNFYSEAIVASDQIYFLSRPANLDQLTGWDIYRIASEGAAQKVLSLDSILQAEGFNSVGDMDFYDDYAHIEIQVYSNEGGVKSKNFVWNQQGNTFQNYAEQSFPSHLGTYYQAFTLFGK